MGWTPFRQNPLDDVLAEPLKKSIMAVGALLGFSGAGLAGLLRAHPGSFLLLHSLAQQGN